MAVVYRFYVAGKPYIGQTFDIDKRWKQHNAHRGNNPMYKVWNANEDKNLEILYTYEGKSTDKSYMRSVLRKKETQFILENDSFLNGWNQQINNESPSQTLNKYILDYKLTKNEDLKIKLLWKINNVNISGRVWNKLFREIITL